jgi:hypothetical protein
MGVRKWTTSMAETTMTSWSVGGTRDLRSSGGARRRPRSSFHGFRAPAGRCCPLRPNTRSRRTVSEVAGPRLVAFADRDVPMPLQFLILVVAGWIGRRQAEAIDRVLARQEHYRLEPQPPGPGERHPLPRPSFGLDRRPPLPTRKARRLALLLQAKRWVIPSRSRIGIQRGAARRAGRPIQPLFRCLSGAGAHPWSRP